MSNIEVRDRIKAIVMEKLGVDEGEVKDSSKFTDDLKADSLDLVELIMELEEAFETEIPEEDAEKIDTFGSAVTYVEQKLAEQKKAD